MWTLAEVYTRSSDRWSWIILLNKEIDIPFFPSFLHSLLHLFFPYFPPPFFFSFFFSLLFFLSFFLSFDLFFSCFFLCFFTSFSSGLLNIPSLCSSFLYYIPLCSKFFLPLLITVWPVLLGLMAVIPSEAV